MVIKNYISVKTKSSDPKLTVRVPEKLKEKLDFCAKRSGRKLNAEVMMRLTLSLELYELITEVPVVEE